jgi:hypothetical protein
MRRTLLPALLMLAIGALTGLADDAKDKDKEKPKPATPAEEFKALVQEHQKAMNDAVKVVREAKTPADRTKAMDSYRKVTTDFGPKMLEFAKKHGKEPVAGEAYFWVLTNAGQGAPAEEAAKHLAADFAQDEKIARGIERLARSQALAAEELVRAVIEKNKDAEIKGRASWTLAQMLKNKADQVQRIKDMEADERKNYEAAFGKEAVDQLLKLDAAKALAEAETLFELCAAKHGDLKVFNNTMKERAEGQLFELRRLAVGMEVPEIEGEDTDGKKFKLSDYRGKVVLLDFWGHW